MTSKQGKHTQTVAISNHTPAPWAVDVELSYALNDKQRFGGFPVFILDANVPVAFVPHGDSDYTCETAKRNALLISKAPEMLEALRELVLCIPKMSLSYAPTRGTVENATALLSRLDTKEG